MACCMNVDLWGGWLTRYDTSQCCCACCCSPFKPRYKRLVDNIFPSNYQDGLVKSNMEKLIFYALSSPEKLDRIGAYLTDRISRDLTRHRVGFVIIAIEAMDQLLVSSHSLNLFVDSFLKVVQLVLESKDPDLQVLATHSFVKFAHIKEDVPSYHRSYDFFVCKFSSLCHSSHSDLVRRKQLRVAGLAGIKGLIRKTVSDQVNIWSELHMEKILPSLLFNMQCKDFEGMQESVEYHKRASITSDSGVSHSDPSSASPKTIAEECLRELISRAPFGQVHSLLKPILKHFDHHRLWEASTEVPPETFAADAFKIIMYSLPKQLNFTAISALMAHLDDVTKSSDPPEKSSRQSKIRVRTGIINVINVIISLSISDIFGPSAFNIISSLMDHLRESINNLNIRYVEEEKLFQEAVINLLGDFTSSLPSYQKLEIMIFIIGKAPPSSATSAADTQLQNIILNGVLKVTHKYRPVSMIQTFPASLISQLMSRALAPDSNVRLTIQKILHQLLDRHNNLSRVMRPVTLTAPEPLIVEKVDRYDINFIRKNVYDILLNIYHNVQLSNNSPVNFYSIYTTMALICIEVNSEEVLIDLLRLAFALQDVACSKSLNLPVPNRCYIHSIVAGFLYLFGHLRTIPAIVAHVECIIKNRKQNAKHLLPEYNDLIHTLHGEVIPEVYRTAGSDSAKTSRQNSAEDLENNDEMLLFSMNVFAEALTAMGYDTSLLATPFLASSQVDASMARSSSDLNNLDIDTLSINSSPLVERRLPHSDINFSIFKEVLQSSQYSNKAEISQKRLNILNTYKNSNFDQLLDNYERMDTETIFDKLLSTIDKSVEECSAAQSEPLTKTFHKNFANDRVDGSRGKEGHTSMSTVDWHVYDNPLLTLSNFSKINPRGPPLFALRFPDLFVY